MISSEIANQIGFVWGLLISADLVGHRTSTNGIDN